MRVLLAALCLPGFAKVQFDIMAMTGYPEVNFPIADDPPSDEPILGFLSASVAKSFAMLP